MKTNSTNKKQRRLKSATKSLKKNYKIYQKAKNEYFCVFLNSLKLFIKKLNLKTNNFIH